MCQGNSFTDDDTAHVGFSRKIGSYKSNQVGVIHWKAELLSIKSRGSLLVSEDECIFTNSQLHIVSAVNGRNLVTLCSREGSLDATGTC